MDIIELKTGNVNVYESLFRQLYEPLCQYAYAILHNSDDAEDMVQSTFCKLWEQREKVDIQTTVKTYLYKMVHNACLNRIKQTQVRSEHHADMAYGSALAYNDVENTLYYNELNLQIESAVASLPQRCREVFLLSRMQNLSYAEIAQQLQISRNTVETQMVKALKILRLKLKDYLLLMIWLFLNIR
jgi:RNA polymerase sigma-70 factor (ECF subfamily)